MNAFEASVPVDVLNMLIKFDAESGRLFWKERPIEIFKPGLLQRRTFLHWNEKFTGKEAFYTKTGAGYLHGALFDQKVLAHRIVWAISSGSWPVASIDHINGIRTDNRPINLRDVPHQENMRNQPRSSASTTGSTGVYFDSGRNKYQAHVTVDGRTVFLGRFKCLDEAKEARAKANQAHEFHINHGRIAS